MKGSEIYKRIMDLCYHYSHLFNKTQDFENEKNSLVLAIDPDSYRKLVLEITMFDPLRQITERLNEEKKIKVIGFDLDIVIDGYGSGERVDVLWRKFILP